MFTIMVGGKVSYMTNNAHKAAGVLALTVTALYPRADWQRAASTFRRGNSVTVGRIAALAV